MPVYKFNHPFLVLYSLAALIYFPIGIGLTFLKLYALAVVYLTSGFLSIIYTRRSTARRYLVDPIYYRAPRNCKLSNFLSTRLGILDIIRLAVLFSCFALSWTSSAILWQRLLAVAVVSIPAISIYPAVEGLIKFYFDWSFRIVLFRRYVSSGAISHKRYVMPLCGLYGQVLLLTDESLSEAWEGISERRVRWVISESYQPLTAERETEAWQPAVEEQLRFADFVVLDWSQDVSSNMEWELAATFKLLPPERIIVLTSGEGEERALKLGIRLGLKPDAIAGIFTIAPRDAFTNLHFILKMQKASGSLTLSPRPKAVVAGMRTIAL